MSMRLKSELYKKYINIFSRYIFKLLINNSISFTLINTRSVKGKP